MADNEATLVVEAVFHEASMVVGTMFPVKARRRWIRFVVRPRWGESFGLLLLSAAVCFGMQLLFARMAFFQDGSAIWWPVNGVALGVLLMVGRRHWPWLLTGFAIGIAGSQHAQSAGNIAGAAVFNTLQVWLPALALPRFRSMDKWLAQPQVALRFMVWAVVVSSIASGLLGAIYSHGRPGDSYWLTVLRWSTGDALGCALATPLMLALLSRETWLLFRPEKLPRTLGLIALMTGTSWLVFHESRVPGAFLIYPLVLLLSTELGMSGAVIAINMVAMIATSATLHGLGPFAVTGIDQEGLRVTALQVFLILSISMTLPVGVARVRRLTTEAKLQRAWQEMQRLAEMDGLTGVANRRRFDAALDAEWLRAKRQRSHLALLLIDADHFKAFNDNYGHLAGDTCLRAIAEAISEVPGRATDLVARYGGEEFALLLPGSDSAGAQRIAELVRARIFAMAMPHLFNGAENRVTVSIGAASVVPNGRSAAVTLIAAADEALYEAKRIGRNGVAVHEAVSV